MSLTKLNTEQLIAKCRHNNQSAQLEIYNRYYKAMYNTAYRILKDSTEAEDIMQEAFLTAYTKLSMLEDDKLFGGWLKKIVVNACLTVLKKNKEYIDVPLERVDYSLTENEGVIEEDLINVKAYEVINSMKQLKTSYSTVLSLHFVEGYDYEEICEILNISNSNCRTLISRAKESLRKKLQVS